MNIGEEKRRAERYSFSCSMSLGSCPGKDSLHRFGPALSQNFSVSGALVTTNHVFKPGERVEIAIPTRHCPASLDLPEELQGVAEVQRVEGEGEESRRVALRFGEEMQQSLEFSLFMAYMAGRSAPNLRN